MLTKDDLNVLSELIDTKFSNQLVEIKSLVRKEVALQIKPLRQDLDKVIIRLSALEERVKNVETALDKTESKLETLDLKIEAFHHKLDEKIDLLSENTQDAIGRVLDTIDELNTKLDYRVNKLEKHVGLS